MRGQLILAVLILLSQSGLVREKRAEYAREARAVLSFLDKEFWDNQYDGFYSNPYGRPIKLSYEQSLVAFAQFALHNATGERKSLERGEAIMRHLSSYDSPYGGCDRVISGPPRFHIQEQAVVMRAYVEAYKSTAKEDYRGRYRALADFILTKLTEGPDSDKVSSWWDAENLTCAPADSCMDYFEPAISLFKAYGVDHNQTFLDAGKRILAGSEQFWDRNNYGYSHTLDDNRRYCRDHATAALAYLSAYDETNRKDYLQRAIDILFYMVSRMGDKVSRTFWEAISWDGEVVEQRRRTVDHLLMVRAYLYAYQVTLEDKYLNQGRSLLDSILSRGYDKSVGSFMDQIGGAVMGDLQVQGQGALTLVEGYRVLTVGPSPLIAIVVGAVMVGLVGFIVYLFRKSWPY